MTQANNPADGYLAHVINNRLARAHHLEPLGNWTLEHRLHRENQPAGDAAPQSDPSALGYLQILKRSYVADLTHVSVADRRTMRGDAPAAVVAIPVASHDEFTQFVGTRLGPLWVYRQTAHVAGGAAYGIGNFNVRFGEVRTGQGSAAQVRGIVVEIEWVEEVNVDQARAEEAIHAIWDEIDTKDGKMKDAKKFFPGTQTGQDFVGERLWFEALKLKP